jgi:hypothetical protein
LDDSHRARIERIERCDHEGTTEPLGGLSYVSVCTACGVNRPTRFGAGAPTVRIACKRDEPCSS